MEASNRILRRKSKQTKWYTCCIAAIVLVVISAIAIPLAVVLSHHQSSSTGLQSNVLLPLYVYSVDGSWNPLFSAVFSRSDLNFTVIINVDSGPGPSQLPNGDFVSEIERLNSYPNVRTVGYVRTNYTLRDIGEVLRDVSAYAGWSNSSSNLAVDGIFFDEMPNEFSEEVLDYSKSINQAVKNATGIHGERTVIHNPGTIPDNRLWDNSTDVTVSFEESYKMYREQQSALGSLPQDRSRYCFMTHSVPSGWSKKSLQDLVDKQSRRAEFLFVTDNSENYYQSFGGNWKTFIDIMPS